MYICYIAGAVFPPLRYLKYILPFLAIFVVFLKDKVTTTKNPSEFFLRNILFAHLFMVFYSFIVLVVNKSLYLRFFEESFFIISPVLFAYIISFFYTDFSLKTLKRLFWLIVLAYVFQQGAKILGIVANPAQLIHAVRYSSISTESQFSFLFGPFFIYFLTTKNYKYSLITFFFLIISLKRISILAALVCLVLYFFGKPMLRSMKKGKAITGILFVLLNLGVVLVLFLITQGYFDDFIVQKVGMSTNHFLRGRYNTYNFVLERLEGFQPWGIGFGKTSHILMNSEFPVKVLHSDVFKNFLEFGIPIFCIWVYIFYKNSAVDIRLLLLAIFYNILFFTDNVFIYFEIMFTFYFFTIIFLGRKNHG